MSKAYQKDTLRSIKKGWKRFLSIMAITALGVAMMTGLYAACLDMYGSADRFYDDQTLFDIRILSTLGLTEEDVEALAEINGVKTAEGAYSETVYTDADGARKTADMSVISQKGLNLPYLLDGNLPAKTGEIAVTQKYLDESGKRIGDTLTIEENLKNNEKSSQDTDTTDEDGSLDLNMETELDNEAESPTFPNTTYTITGVVMDPMDIRSNDKASTFRSSGNADYIFFILAEDVKSDVFTGVYLALSATREMDSFSDEYKNTVRTVVRDIETRIKAQREQARYDSILLEANTKIKDAEKTIYDKFAEADEKFSDARKDITEAEQELADGEATLLREQKDAQRKIAEARAELEQARRDLADAEEQLVQGEEELAQGESELNRNVQELADGEKKLLESEQELADGEKELLDREQELADGEKELSDGELELADGKKELLKGEQELADGRNRLIEAGGQLADGETQLAQGEAELNANAQKLAEGRRQLAEEQKKALDQFTAAKQQLDDAQGELDDARTKLEAGIEQLKSDFGNAWPADEWNTLVKAATDLAALNQAIDALNQQLASATQQAAEAQTELSKRQTAANAAQDLLNSETEKLITIKEGTPEYGTQQSVVTEAQNVLDAANTAVTDARAVLNAANEAVKSLTATRDSQVSAAAKLAAAIEQMNAPELVVQAALGMGKVIGGQQALDAQKIIFTEQKAAALQELAKADVELSAGEAQIEEARKLIEGGKAELAAGKAALAQGWTEWTNGKAKLDEGWAEWEDGRAEFAEGRAEWEDGRAKLDEGWAEWEDGRVKLAEGWAEWEDGKAKLTEGWAEWEDGKAELTEGRAELEDGRIELADGEAKLKKEEANAKTKLGDAWDEIVDGKLKLADGKAELAEQELEYAHKKEEATQKLDDAYAKLDDIDKTQWYVQDRTSLDSYSSLSSDLSSIEAVGKVFPVIFLLVAVLMSLTTMTRMVEEERGLMGTYKALGFGNMVIYRKYLLFAFMACMLGGIAGDLFGFIFMPRFMSVVLDVLYLLPHFYLSFDVPYGVGGVVLFMAGIMGATALACHKELSQKPAELMRPKAPRAGSRVILERIPVLWNHLSFLKKVTVRNLFRYKKRLFMTVGGIAGCTALILCGFAIKDSIEDLNPKQYEQVYQYDLLAVWQEEDNDSLAGQMAADGSIKDFLNLRIETVTLTNSKEKSEKVQLMVIPQGTSIRDYIHTEKPDGTLIHPDDDGVLITQNAAQILNLAEGDKVTLQDMELTQHEAVISGIVKNYLGNNVYMTQRQFESLFGVFAPNGVLAHLSDAGLDHAAYAEELLNNDSVLSAVSTAALRENFGFDLINAIVLLIIAMAGGLAFVVLFTLSSTNISERARELATIKVLGFYDNEVHQYVNKETMILTSIGILVGLPVGRILSGFLTVLLNMPSIYFAVRIEPVSYVISAAITLVFSIVVNWITNRSLDNIRMVEALKSVE